MLLDAQQGYHLGNSIYRCLDRIPDMYRVWVVVILPRQIYATILQTQSMSRGLKRRSSPCSLGISAHHQSGINALSVLSLLSSAFPRLMSVYTTVRHLRLTPGIWRRCETNERRYL